MPKSPDAFRTISEVAEWLEIQAHVLRFWESKFTQVKPIKRAGGRRYYRPNDMLLLGGIKRLLHEDGLTIKGVQKVLREEGMGHVAALSAPLDGGTQDDLDAGGDTIDMTPAPMQEDAEQTHEGVILPFEQRASKAAKPAPVEAPETHVEAASAPEMSAEDTPPLPADEPTLDATEAEPEETTVAPADTSAEDGATLPGFLRHPMTDAPVPQAITGRTKPLTLRKHAPQIRTRPRRPSTARQRQRRKTAPPKRLRPKRGTSKPQRSTRHRKPLLLQVPSRVSSICRL